MPRLRMLSPTFETAPIAGFDRDHTLALEAGAVHIALGDAGLEVAPGESPTEIVRFSMLDGVWRAHAPVGDVAVNGAIGRQVPFTILSDGDVVTRGKRLALRFEAPDFSLACFGTHEGVALLSPYIGTAPFVFRAVRERGGVVELGRATYGRSGMEIELPAPCGVRLSAIADACKTGRGQVPIAVLQEIATQLHEISLGDQPTYVFGDVVRAEECWVTETGTLERLFNLPADTTEWIEDAGARTWCAIAKTLADVAGIPAKVDVIEQRVVFDLDALGPQAEHPFYADVVEMGRGQTPKTLFHTREEIDLGAWAREVASEAFAANARVREQIEMMDPRDLLRLRAKTVPANPRGAQ